METFGVSRTVLREALRTLTSKGLIESRPRVGTRVRPKPAWNLLDADVLDWYSRVAPQMDFALKLQEMREMIEPYAAGLAAAAYSDESFGAPRQPRMPRWSRRATSMNGCAPISSFI